MNTTANMFATQRAYNLGDKAYAEGERATTNPYNPDDNEAEHDAWNNGYWDASTVEVNAA